MSLTESQESPLDFHALLRSLTDAGVEAEALGILKRMHPRSSEKKHPWHLLRVRLEAASQNARERRMARWQHDPLKQTLRLKYEIRHPATQLNPSALQSLLAQACLTAGLPLAQSLEKKPKPILRLGQPLPAGVEGLEEWADAVLQAPLSIPIDALVVTVSAHCPPGLMLKAGLLVPNHASPVLDLGREAHWRWTCPEQLLPEAQRRMATFLAACEYTIEKTGKVDGQKQIKHLDVRPFVLQGAWQDSTLCFVTRIQSGEALNPIKVLAAILDVEPAMISGLLRERVVLGEDPRLAQSDKYEPKLSSIYEDAVLLESTGHLSLMEDDDDDDEPTVLGR